MIKKIFLLISTRPLSLFEHLRGRFRFLAIHYLRYIKEVPGLKAGKAVRLQRYSSIKTELPRAKVEIGDNCIIYESNRIEVYGEGVVRIGENSVLGGARIICRNEIKLGENCLCSWGVFIQDFDPHSIDPELREREVNQLVASFYPRLGCDLNIFSESNLDFNTQAILIGKNVWIGADVTILKGVVIGDNSIIATKSVVTKGDYPKGAILAGNPARVVKIVE